MIFYTMLKSIAAIIVHIRSCLQWYCTCAEVEKLGNIKSYLGMLYFQYYVYFGGQKYVDLGLGTHRVKCRVDDGFK